MSKQAAETAGIADQKGARCPICAVRPQKLAESDTSWTPRRTAARAVEVFARQLGPSDGELLRDRAERLLILIGGNACMDPNLSQAEALALRDLGEAVAEIRALREANGVLLDADYDEPAQAGESE